METPAMNPPILRTFFALAQAFASARRTFASELASRTAVNRRAAAQQRRLRAMSDHELLRASISWGGAMTYPELRRRGLPVPGDRK
jgi:hypothetical protein